ncbi:hypothetical protein M0E87_10725 [Corynebacterium sp. CCM 9185]|uniref:DUF3515 domain-containing protein n=1 Tax=Corynebacterium marambiense TaxID=2765364 RepID=A0ABS0VUD1_9CORY|nr:hypothetical protein [Corynebacterium marambiense]MBI9000374.1 hypothetical protein [Corynebacterium marambiense]MCK7664124.1 hypothetical protein [Corynebacterium marambiense]MCX7543569.1 hypothetical protein [Corynebacterium marambiense]
MSRRPIVQSTSVFLAITLVAAGLSSGACDFGRDPLLKTLEAHPDDVVPARLYDSGATGMAVICPYQPRAAVDEVLGGVPHRDIPEAGLLDDSNAIGIVKPSGRTIIKRFGRSKVDLCSRPVDLKLYPGGTRATFEDRGGTFTLVALDPENTEDLDPTGQ